jgi:hypothetical protein
MNPLTKLKILMVLKRHPDAHHVTNDKSGMLLWCNNAVPEWNKEYTVYACKYEYGEQQVIADEDLIDILTDKVEEIFCYTIEEFKKI